MSEAKTYTNPDCVRFMKDMKKAGIETVHYNGRWFWSGPAVFTDEQNGPTLQEVMGATKVKLQRDNLASNWVVYPVSSNGRE